VHLLLDGRRRRRSEANGQSSDGRRFDAAADLFVENRYFRATICYAIRPLSAVGLLSQSSVLSVTLVYCGLTVGWIKMALGTEIGLGIGHIVIDRDQFRSSQGAQRPHFSAHVHCDQTVGLIKMLLGTR